jgi:hypothetical protein
MSLDRDASDRTLDRQLAYLGLLDDAAPLFREGSWIPGVGVLLALPCLVESGLFRISRKLYGEIGPGPAAPGAANTDLPCSLILWAIGYRSRRSVDAPQCMRAQVRRIALSRGGGLQNTFRNEGARALRSAPGGERGARESRLCMPQIRWPGFIGQGSRRRQAGRRSCSASAGSASAFVGNSLASIRRA